MKFLLLAALSLPLAAQHLCWFSLDSTGSYGCRALPTIAGPIGPTGATGRDGSPGIPGATGKDGATGPAGLAGPIGPIGPIGPATQLPPGFAMVNGQPTPNTAVMLSWTDAEQASDKWCLASGKVSAYTCSLKVKTTAIPRMVILLADVPCNGGCFLNVDGTGQKSIRLNDNGNTDVKFAAGVKLLVFDGIVWRLL